MFMGEYHPAMDDKGRISIPVKLRRAFGETAVINKLTITHGFDKCIMAFRREEWGDFVENRLMKLPQDVELNRKIMRLMMGGATECELDKQGRIIIPSYLMKYANIDKDVAILGLYNKIEIWSREVYDKYKPNDEEMDVFAKELGF